MRLKLDENLGSRGRELLATAGHEVATAAELDLCAAEDRRIYDDCLAEERILVTLDLDFSNPFSYPPGPTAGIVVLRLPDKPSYEDLLTTVRVLVRALRQNDPREHLWVADAEKVRVWQPRTET